MAAKPNEEDRQELPANVDENLQAIARLHAAHAKSATPAEWALEGLVALLGRPALAGILTLFVAGWIAANLWIAHSHHAAFDPPPFSLLETILTLLALYMTVMILIVQRRAQRLADHREQLMLQLAILSDQKTAKLIALIEELRRDDPLISNRADEQARELATPADPEAMLDLIRENRGQQAQPDEPKDLG